LEEKMAECSEYVSELQLLRSKLKSTEMLLAEHSKNDLDKNAHSIDREASLKAEISALTEELASLFGSFSVLEGQKADVEKSLEERNSDVQNLELQIQILNAKVIQSSNLHGELPRVRMLLDEKIKECQTITQKLLNTQSDRDVVVAKSEENSNEISRLQSKIDKLLNDHNATLTNVEEQLAVSLQKSTTLREQCREYRTKYEHAHKECLNITNSTADTISKYTDEVSTLKGENLDLLNSLQKTQAALQEKQLEASVDASKVGYLQKSIDTMRQEMDSIVHHNQELLEEKQVLMQEKANVTLSLEAQAENAEEQTKFLQKELMDVHSNLDSSQSARAIVEQTVKELKEQLQDLKATNEELANKLCEASLNTEAEKQIEFLQLECTKLRSCLDNSQQASIEAEHTLTGLKKQLEDKAVEISFERLEVDRLTKENTFLRNERGELREELRIVTHRVNKAGLHLDDSLVANGIPSSEGRYTSVEKEALLERINELEKKLKMESLSELRDELTSLHEERQHLDLDNEELLVQLGLMQQEKIENQIEWEAEMQTLREQVSTLQDQCKYLQNELEKLNCCATVLGEDGKENNLNEKGIKLPHLSLTQPSESDSLKQRSQDLEPKSSQKIESLHQTLGSLEANEKEKIEHIEEKTQNAVDAKDEKIFLLKSCNLMQENELKEMSSKLDATNNQINLFNQQLECRRSQGNQFKSSLSCCDDEEEEDYEEMDISSLQDLLADAVLDSDDYHRSQIVVLAQALEKAEFQRADALERFFIERKSNGESLRQLGESLKRFYSSVRCSDAT